MSVASYATTEWMLDAVCLGIPDFTELPISEQVAAAVFDGRSPGECLRNLMGRAPASEG